MEVTHTETLVHPFKPDAVARTNNANELYLLMNECKEQIGKLRHIEQACRSFLGMMAEGTARTRRLAIDSDRRLKLEFEGPKWSQDTLKAAVKQDAQQCFGFDAANVVPKLVGAPGKDGPIRYLKIATFGVNSREIKKLKDTSGNQRFEDFKALLLSGESESTNPPRVTLEGAKK